MFEYYIYMNNSGRKKKMNNGLHEREEAKHSLAAIFHVSWVRGLQRVDTEN